MQHRTVPGGAGPCDVGSQPLGDDYSGEWTDTSTFAIRLLTPSAVAPQLGTTQVEVVGDIRNSRGMPSGVKEFNVVNLNLIEANFEDGETVNLASLTAKGVLKPQGAARALPLKVLGTGEIAAKVTVEAQAFSTSAKAKLEAAGATATEIAGKRKWVRAMGKTSQKAAPGRPKKQG